MIVKIDRSRWLRGEPKSCLLRATDHKMCCMGFYALQTGHKPKEISGLGVLEDLDWEGRSLTRPDLVLSHMVDEVYRINDDLCLDDATREEKLNDLLDEFNIQLEFHNGPAPAITS